MKAKALPAMFWGKVVNTAVYILNRSPTRSLNGKTPYEAWHGERSAVLNASLPLLGALLMCGTRSRTSRSWRTGARR